MVNEIIDLTSVFLLLGLFLSIGIEKKGKVLLAFGLLSLIRCFEMGILVQAAFSIVVLVSFSITEKPRKEDFTVILIILIFIAWGIRAATLDFGLNPLAISLGALVGGSLVSWKELKEHKVPSPLPKGRETELLLQFTGIGIAAALVLSTFWMIQSNLMIVRLCLSILMVANALIATTALKKSDGIGIVLLSVAFAETAICSSIFPEQATIALIGILSSELIIILLYFWRIENRTKASAAAQIQPQVGPSVGGSMPTPTLGTTTIQGQVSLNSQSSNGSSNWAGSMSTASANQMSSPRQQPSSNQPATAAPSFNSYFDYVGRNSVSPNPPPGKVSSNSGYSNLPPYLQHIQPTTQRDPSQAPPSNPASYPLAKGTKTGATNSTNVIPNAQSRGVPDYITGNNYQPAFEAISIVPPANERQCRKDKGIFRSPEYSSTELVQYLSRPDLRPTDNIDGSVEGIRRMVIRNGSRGIQELIDNGILCSNGVSQAICLMAMQKIAEGSIPDQRTICDELKNRIVDPESGDNWRLIQAMILLDHFEGREAVEKVASAKGQSHLNRFWAARFLSLAAERGSIDPEN